MTPFLCMFLFSKDVAKRLVRQKESTLVNLCCAGAYFAKRTGAASDEIPIQDLVPNGTEELKWSPKSPNFVSQVPNLLRKINEKLKLVEGWASKDAHFFCD